MFRIIVLISFILHLTSCDWVSEWMSPIHEQIKVVPVRRTNNDLGASLLDDDNLRMVRVTETTEGAEIPVTDGYSMPSGLNHHLSDGNLKTKLESTLENAKMLADTLNVQIKQVLTRENILKEAVVNGRSGVSSVLVTASDRPTRTYFVRDGVWTQCRGVLQQPNPAPSNVYNELVTTPKCLGQEIASQPDPCAFNSVIKYETVPVVRRLQYTEDDYLCLKQSFNSTLERYMSVPRRVINETCQNGVVRSLEDNNAKCGVRVLSEYTYYPFRGYATGLPLEYCSEPDGSCKLIMAWHVSNATVENFEFLKNEQGFKKYFIKSDGISQHVI